MRIIANENVIPTAIAELRKRGYDVVAVREVMPAAADDEILAQAQNDNRLVLTHDKDFGELAFRFGLPASSGVLLIRLSGSGPLADAEHVVNVVESRSDWAGHFSVSQRGRLRMRPLPSARPTKPK
jgi:predicted nuclease of predicted toxin-antitoxin system